MISDDGKATERGIYKIFRVNVDRSQSSKGSILNKIKFARINGCITIEEGSYAPFMLKKRLP